jgi:hypothetical protein
MARVPMTRNAALLRVLLVGTMALVMMILSSVDVDGDPATTNLPVVVQAAASEVQEDEQHAIVRRRIRANSDRGPQRRRSHRVQLLSLLHCLEFRLHVPPVRGP